MLKINIENKAGRWVRPGKRLYTTKDGMLCEPDDPRAYALYCTEYDEVDIKDLERRMPKAAKRKKGE